jgi:protein-disulfide isomerase
MAGPDRQQRILIIVAVAFFLLVVGGGIGLQAWRTQRAPSAVPSPAATTAPMTVADGVPLVLGPADAPVKIAVYEDFHCPHCAEFEEEFGETLTEAQRSGKARIELYPMSFIDEGSAAAANAMACASEAGFGQNYYQGLFANHTLKWSDEQLIDLAGKVGGNVSDGFRTCVTTKRHAGWVDSINTAAEKNGVQGTPTMFLNGSPVDLETLTPESLKAMIDQAAG